MSFELTPLGRFEPARPSSPASARRFGGSLDAARARAADAAPGGSAATPAARVELSGAELLPATPPPQLWPEVQAAAARVDDLRAQGRELRFEPDPQAGRVRIEVRDLEGNVLRQIPARGMLDVLEGADP